MNFKKLTISPASYYDLLIKPNFADLIPGGQYTGTLSEFTVMDDVSSKRKIIDILGARNILKRRDASCNITFSPVGKASIRTIETDPIYGATQQCDNEFYQGCLEDFRNSNPKFTDFILDFFLKAIKVDINSNMYFGDITRPNDATGNWNWNTFDGIFKHYFDFINKGIIPANQTTAFNSGAITPQDGYDFLHWAWGRQDIFLRHLPNEMKAFYVSQSIFDAYEEFLILTGGANNIQYYINGIPKLKFKGIDVLVETTWDPILNILNGGNDAHACILTIRGNFVFATDKTYGERTDTGVEALSVWYDRNSYSWKYVNFLRAGTGIAYPEHSVIGLTNF
ncbi:hypothetical protein ETU08_00035 [Apibacter muscae]|uniref:hypothetical protein n=1 Tax=Apibacter muscae TaxID=2509004 RepID=UPI0011ADF0DE|nr:hypothetical protein [Apibacter muscae]TWP31882.1 hypothetical protein ETU08_00035 [Apibacter muscae]